jgi:hypothetical protein
VPTSAPTHCPHCKRPHCVGHDDLSIERRDDGWDGPTAMVAFDGRLYIIQNGHLHRVSPTTLHVAQHVGGWTGSVLML